MIRQEQISNIIDSQNNAIEKKEAGIIRNELSNIPNIESFATIITGVRRCGKSTLLLQLRQKQYHDALFINFEDIRFVGFDSTDFNKLQSEIEKRKTNVIFFDEIQLIPSWEIYINQILRDGFIVFITCSNASMLSKELGTNLTGRHLSMELFPFSYEEFIRFKEYKSDENAVEKFLNIGGFPEFVKNENSMILSNLLEDIIIRDIAIRHSIRDINSLKHLAIYLISNVGKPISANNILSLFEIKSTSTIIDYINYLKDSFLVDLLPQFSYSLKALARNPKKVYAIDTGLVTVISESFSMDIGRKFENMIFLHLRKLKFKLFFYKNKGECDFIIFDKTKAIIAIQVCYFINDDNFNREMNGLVEAMEEFGLKTGYIVSFNQKDEFQIEGKIIKMLPAHEFLMNKLEL